MIIINVVKKRKINHGYEQLQALTRRLTSNHPSIENVNRDYKNIRSSVRGEHEVEFPLRFLPQEKYVILHDLRLADDNGYFQIDSLLLHKNFILILEIKNWYGTIFFCESGQVTRVGDDGKEEGFPNPIPQAKLQKHRLKKWLHTNGYNNVTVDFLIVISFPSTIIKSSSPSYPIPHQVIHNNDLLFRIQSLESKYIEENYSMKQLNELSTALLQAHTQPQTNILDKYNVNKEELIKGVFCPNCGEVPMIRKRQMWYCTKCCNSSVHAHLQAFNDYKLLISDFISNRKARDFLQIQSPYIVKHMLQKAGFKQKGKTSSVIYELAFR